MKKTVRKRLDEIAAMDRTFLIDGQECAIIEWAIQEDNVIVSLAGGYDKKRYDKTISIDDVEEFIEILEDQIKVAPAPSSQAPRTLNDVREILLENIHKLQSGELEVEKAESMAKTAQVVVNLTKLELEYKKEIIKSGLTKNQFLELNKFN